MFPAAQRILQILEQSELGWPVQLKKKTKSTETLNERSKSTSGRGNGFIIVCRIFTSQHHFWYRTFFFRRGASYLHSSLCFKLTLHAWLFFFLRISLCHQNFSSEICLWQRSRCSLLHAFRNSTIKLYVLHRIAVPSQGVWTQSKCVET